MVITFPSKAHECAFTRLGKILQRPAYISEGRPKTFTTVTHMGKVMHTHPFLACCLLASTNDGGVLSEEIFLWLLDQKSHFIKSPE